MHSPLGIMRIYQAKHFCLCYNLYIHTRIHTHTHIYIYCTLRGQIKGFNSSITTIMYEVGNYRSVVG